MPPGTIESSKGLRPSRALLGFLTVWAPLKGELSLQATEGLYVRGRASESHRHFPIEGRQLAAPRLFLKATHFSPFGPAAFPRKGVWETL